LYNDIHAQAGYYNRSFDACKHDALCDSPLYHSTLPLPFDKTWIDMLNEVDISNIEVPHPYTLRLVKFIKEHGISIDDAQEISRIMAFLNLMVCAMCGKRPERFLQCFVSYVAPGAGLRVIDPNELIQRDTVLSAEYLIRGVHRLAISNIFDQNNARYFLIRKKMIVDGMLSMGTLGGEYWDIPNTSCLLALKMGDATTNFLRAHLEHY